ncbi:hypothetical protein ACHAQH_003718 [Verticillium albo-atrum]
MSRKHTTRGEAASPSVSATSKRVAKGTSKKVERVLFWKNCKQIERKNGDGLLWVLRTFPDRVIGNKKTGFSIDDCGTKSIAVEGIRSYPAQSLMRQMKVGDRALILHVVSTGPYISGIVSVSKEKSPDLSACDIKSPHYDARQPNYRGRIVDVDKLDFISIHVTLERKFNEPIMLETLRCSENKGVLRSMQVLQQSQMDVSTIGQDA